MAESPHSASHAWASLVAGGALLAGSMSLAVKALAILMTGVEPPYVFAVSPFFYGLGVLLLARALELVGSRNWVVPGLGLTSLLTGAATTMTELPGGVSSVATATATLAAIAGAVVSGWHPRGDARKRALVLVGLVVVPALVLGGVLAEFNERLLEIGLLLYAGFWALAGFKLIESTWRSDTSGNAARLSPRMPE